jgi:hypothetical protein
VATTQPYVENVQDEYRYPGDRVMRIAVNAFIVPVRIIFNMQVSTTAAGPLIVRDEHDVISGIPGTIMNAAPPTMKVVRRHRTSAPENERSTPQPAERLADCKRSPAENGAARPMPPEGRAKGTAYSRRWAPAWAA